MCTAFQKLDQIVVDLLLAINALEAAIHTPPPDIEQAEDALHVSRGEPL